MKPVYKYNDKNEYICKYESQSDAAREFGDSKYEANIRNAINKSTLWNGFYWSNNKSITNSKSNKFNNVLIIGDLHEPFTLDGYLEFCMEIYFKYKCTEAVFIGDVVDNHFSSFHDTDADGHSAAMELKMAKANIAKWHSIFPNAKVCLGNHDLIPSRKLFSSGVSQSWIRPIGDVLDTPTWEYAESFIIDNVMYTHGTGRKASKRMMKDIVNVVQGHYHSESYIEYSVGINHRLFAMQIGSGVDHKSYAMAYGKHFDKQHINCGVVLENGKLPILEYMNL